VPSLDWLPATIRQSSTLRHLEANETLFHRGEKASAIFEVEQGRLRLIRHAINSQQVILHTARSGELFAEAALFAAHYHCDAVATVTSCVRAYSKRKLLVAFRGDPALGEHFMALLAHEIQALRALLEQRNIRSARNRVLHYLMLAAGDDGLTLRLDGTLMDLAAELGLTHEALYRTLAELEKDGLITRTRSAITLRKGRLI
jgi:CRP-like cAMP-binding protein